MESGMTAMIISFADTPQVVQEFTDNRRLLRERLATIQPTVRGTDLHGALDLADGLANPGRITTEEGGTEIDVVEPQPATVYIFSDGRFEDVKGFSLGNLEAGLRADRLVRGQEPGDHRVRTRRSDAKPEERQALCRSRTSRKRPSRRSSKFSSTASFSMPSKLKCRPANRAAWCFRLADAPAGKLTARLKYELDTPTKRDALEQDDTGYAALNDAKPGRVLVVTPGNVALEIALATERAGRLANIEFKTPDCS